MQYAKNFIIIKLRIKRTIFCKRKKWLFLKYQQSKNEIKMIRKLLQLITLVFLVTLLISNKGYPQNSIYEPVNIDTVHFSTNDFGRMWTFDDIPFQYFKQKYQFTPSQKWLNEVQLSALQFGRGCSAAFVSSNGLIMTNHHCGRGQLKYVQRENENLLRDGFYAATLAEERKIPNLYVDQLISIDDVTKRIINVMNSTKTDDEKIQKKSDEMKKIQNEFAAKNGFICKVVTLYNGGKYSVYSYKRYNDIRLVMSPDFQIAATGWDWDNFTYPRYELDFAFFRAYDENGKPIHSKNFFKISKVGAKDGELIFTVGRPGHTDRLLAFSELEFLKDFTYKQRLVYYNELYKAFFELFKSHPEKESEMLNSVMGLGNARKSYAGRLVGLKNPYIMKKKKDFENNLISIVNDNVILKQNYENIWSKIEVLVNEKKKVSNEVFCYSLINRKSVVYLTIADKLLKYAEQVKLDDDEREEEYKQSNLEETIESIFPKDYDLEKSKLLLRAFVNTLSVLIPNDAVVKNILNNKNGNAAVEYLLENSLITTKEKVTEFLSMNPDKIANSFDPFISLLQLTKEKLKSDREKLNGVNNKLEILDQKLGKLVFDIYGDKIPPDATSTLRISDGVIKGYEYNGTIAPGKTTFYGLWDRYNSFGKKTYPWGLHPRWKNPPAGFDLTTSVGFASTNDIVGGNSGSSIINKNGEVVGLVHDGNMESLSGHIIYLEENNRTVATDIIGLMQALKYIYKTEPLLNELDGGGN